MSEEKIQNITSPQPEEQEIDLIELAQKVWASRKLVFKACVSLPLLDWLLHLVFLRSTLQV
jgi:LPS O-antigen subunit length determinant protein (WzzB/FepE family)